jgi:hypothetical protein
MRAETADEDLDEVDEEGRGAEGISEGSQLGKSQWLQNNYESEGKGEDMDERKEGLTAALES